MDVLGEGRGTTRGRLGLLWFGGVGQGGGAQARQQAVQELAEAGVEGGGGVGQKGLLCCGVH